MHLLTKTALAGLATLTLASGALAVERNYHTMNVALPDGSVAHIQYVGDTPPLVDIDRSAAAPIAFAMPFDRLFADLDRQADAAMRQAALLARAPATGEGTLDSAAFKALPPGTVHYSFVSTSSGNGTCARSYEVTSSGTGAPRTVSHSSGDCGAARTSTSPVAAKPAPAAEALPRDAI